MIKWHLLSEDKPPETNSSYLITDNYGGLQMASWTNAAYFTINETTDWHWVGLQQYTKVIAWMPLPEPYLIANWRYSKEYSTDVADYFYCTNCDEEVSNTKGYIPSVKYCPDCGARMIEVEEE